MSSGDEAKDSCWRRTPQPVVPGSKVEPKVTKKRPKIDFCDLEFDMLFTVRTPCWEVSGELPKGQKCDVFSRALPGGVRRRICGPKVVKWVENGSHKGLQNGAKSVKKGVPKTRPHSYDTLWAPIGGPGALLGGFGVVF